MFVMRSSRPRHFEDRCRGLILEAKQNSVIWVRSTYPEDCQPLADSRFNTAYICASVWFTCRIRPSSVTQCWWKFWPHRRHVNNLPQASFSVPELWSSRTQDIFKALYVHGSRILKISDTTLAGCKGLWLPSAKLLKIILRDTRILLYLEKTLRSYVLTVPSLFPPTSLPLSSLSKRKYCRQRRPSCSL